MSLYITLQEECYEANMLLPEKKLVLYTFGNVSIIDRHKGVVAIKPSGIPYEELRPEDMVIVDMACHTIMGKMRPSSDTKTHVLLYHHFPKIGSIVHTHSTYATAWAQAMRPIPNLGTTHADHLVNAIPCTEVMSDEMIKGDYEVETGNQILEAFKNMSYDEVEMVLVACHGPFTWGKNAQKAIYNSVILEELARMAYLTLQINPLTPTIKDSLIEKHYQRKHGNNAYYGQSY